MNPFAVGGALEIVYGVLAVAFAFVVYHADPRNTVNRALATFLLVDGATSGGLMAGLTRFVEDPATAHALTSTQYLGNGSRPFLYLAFIAAALPLRWTRPLDTTAGRVALYTLAVAGGLSCALLGVGWPILKDALQGMFIAVGLVGFVSAIVALRRTHGPMRQKMRAYLNAFAVRDVGVLLLLPIRDLAVDGSLLQGWTLVAVKVVYVAFILMVVYGVLFGKMVDLDASARAAFTRTAAVTVVATGFVVVTESLEASLPLERLPFDMPAIALAASVAMAFLFQPVQQWTEGLALRLFPGGRAKPVEYAFAVEEALQHRTLSPAEQRVLDGIWHRHRRKGQ